MSRTGRSEEFMEFRALLREWEKVVDHYARRSRRRPPVSPQAYPVLHGELLRACRSQLAGADEREKQALKKLIDLIGPWVTLESLTSSRTPILTDLSEQCLRIQDVLEGRTRHRFSWGHVVLAASVLLMVVAGVALARFGFGSEESLASFGSQSRRFLREVALDVRYSTFLEKFALVTVVVVIIGILSMTKGLRKWT